MTPAWAPSVVPAASAEALGQEPKRSANGPASMAIPTVAATESWKPIA